MEKSQMGKKNQDLGIKIGTKEEVFWTDMKEKVEIAILNAKRDIVINEEILKLCEKKIEAEQVKKQ